MEKVKVMIVDDSRVSCAMLSDVLSKTNFEVCAVARNAADAVELYKKHHPVVVTMDMNLPDADGLECSRRIRAINSNVKIIMISAMKDASLISRGRSVGVSSFLQKPVDTNELIDTLLFLCQSRAGQIAVLRESYVKSFAKVLQQSLLSLAGLKSEITVDLEEEPYLNINGVAVVIGLTGYPVGRAILHMNSEVMREMASRILAKDIDKLTDEEACESVEEAGNIIIGRGVSAINDVFRDKEMRITPPGTIAGDEIKIANLSITSFAIKAVTRVGDININIGFAEGE